MLPPVPEQTAGATTRKLYEDFTAAAACSACHNLINGVGFAFENYDAVGGFRDKEEGQAGRRQRHADLPSGAHSFKNAVEFVKAIAKAPEVRDCVARNWMRFAAAAGGAPTEGGSLKAISEAFEPPTTTCGS